MHHVETATLIDLEGKALEIADATLKIVRGMYPTTFVLLEMLVSHRGMEIQIYGCWNKANQ
jgi:hypothetical protein